MKEWSFKTDISDVRLTFFLFDDSFTLKRMYAPRNELMRQLSFHQHMMFEIFFSIKDLSVASDNGTDLYSNSVVIIPPGVNHYTESDIPSVYSLFFSLSKIKNTGKNTGDLYDLLSEKLNEGIVSVLLSENVYFYLNRISETMKDSGFNEQTEHLIPLIFSEIFYSVIPRKSPSSNIGMRGKYINTLDGYIASHFCENVRLEDIAKEVYLCPKQVSRIIKKVYGCTLSELVHKKRLKVACRLLKYSEMPVNAIAAAVGYEYENYFFTRFKAVYGMTPLEFRNNSNNSFIEKR